MLCSSRAALNFSWIEESCFVFGSSALTFKATLLLEPTDGIWIFVKIQCCQCRFWRGSLWWSTNHNFERPCSQVWVFCLWFICFPCNQSNLELLCLYFMVDTFPSYHSCWIFQTLQEVAIINKDVFNGGINFSSFWCYFNMSWNRSICFHFIFTISFLGVVELFQIITND